MQLKKGTALKGGEFIIEGVLGNGGFGITYLAHQTGLNRKVAVKEFFMEDFCNRDEDTSNVSVPSVGRRDQVLRFRKQFVKEAQTIAALNHPNIIKIISVFEENGTAYYVMEYVDGGSLDKMSTPESPMPEAEATKYVIQVAKALDYLHANNILHLDVKPANILVCDGKAVLIDFGISKRYDPDYGEQTSTNMLAISDGYAPLEQYTKDGLARFTPAVDVYSLGATLYKLVTGYRPLSSGELAVSKNGIEIPAGISRHTADAIRAAMAPAVGNRLQSVSAFVDMLQAEETKVMKTPPLPLPPVPPPSPSQKPQLNVYQQPVRTQYQEQKEKHGGGFMKWLCIALVVILAGIVAWWGYSVYSERKMEKTVGSFMQYIADEWMAEDPEGAVNALIEYGEWYGEQSVEDQQKIDRIEQEWMDANPYEDMLLDEFWEYLEQEEVVESDYEDYGDYDWSDILSDPDVQEFALDLLDELLD